MKLNIRRLELILLLIVTFLVIFMLCMLFLPGKSYAGEIHGELSFGYIGEDQDGNTEWGCEQRERWQAPGMLCIQRLIIRIRMENRLRTLSLYGLLNRYKWQRI